MSFGFAHPWALALLLLLPLYALALRRRRPGAIAFSRAGTIGAFAGDAARRLAALPTLLRALAFAVLVIAMAGPRTGASAVDVDTSGISIALTLDISSSMLAEDFSPYNRLTVAKLKLIDFVRARETDRLGLVAFAGEALTQVPLTVDHDVVVEALRSLEIGALDDGTAIGTAIATAANRLRDAPGESRVMILMTDGENNRGEIDPVTAARAAAAFDIRIYTIGVGSEGVAPIPVARGLMGGYQYANLPVHIDEALLGEIARIGRGRYFRATNERGLDSIYHQIDRMERTRVEARRYIDYTPHYLPLVLAGSLLLLLEWALRASRWGRVP